MERLLITLLVAAVAIGGAALFNHRRNRPAPTVMPGKPPDEVARDEFVSPEAPWLIAVFSSATCMACAAVWDDIRRFETPRVVTQNVELTADPRLHKRYRIDSVPTTVVVDTSDSVRLSFVGPLSPKDKETLAALVA